VSRDVRPRESGPATDFGLSRLVFGGLFPAAESDGLVAVFRVYFDSSSSDEIVTVGGYLASIDAWERLEPDWNRILLEEGVKEHRGFRCLHMKDLASGRRWFEGWNEDQRRRLLGRLAPLLNVRVHLAVARSVSIRGFDDAMAILCGQVPGPPLTIVSFALVQAMHAVGAWCLHRGVTGPRVGYFFESGEPRATVREINESMNEIASDPARKAVYRFAGWGFVDKRVVPVQTADWLAYEAHLYGKRHLLPKLGYADVCRRAVRRSFRELKDRAPEWDVKYLLGRDGILRAIQFNYDAMMQEREG
jgi:hypothetical protein